MPGAGNGAGQGDRREAQPFKTHLHISIGCKEVTLTLRESLGGIRQPNQLTEHVVTEQSGAQLFGQCL